MSRRIWELDAFRGVCILGMVIVHTVYDLTELYGMVDWTLPLWFTVLQEWGAILFILLSGICATLGSRHLKRGLLVLACGLAVTAVTAGMYALGMAGSEMIIYFGVLHCLGVCMLLWHLFRRLPSWALTVAGVVMAAAGLWMKSRSFDVPAILAVVGLARFDFFTPDYFPLLPHLGFFLLGSVLGRRLYPGKESLFPKVDPRHPIVCFFTFCGRQSLWIYLLHQPVLTLLFWLLA